MSDGNPHGTGLTRAQLLHEMGLTSQWRLREQAVLRRASKAALAPPPAAIPAAASAATAAIEEAPLGEVGEAVELLAPAPVASNAALPVVDREQLIARLDWDGLQHSVAECRACGLCQERRQAVLGVGDRRAEWLFIGEGPGVEEDARGEPFVGPAGKLLDAMLAAIDLQRGENVYIANAVKCRPPGNRTPESAEIATCAPYLRRQIALIRPRLIVLLGRAAANAVLGDIGSLASLRGKTFEYRDADSAEMAIPVVVSYHPAYLLRTLQDKAKAWEDLCRARMLMRAATTSASLSG
ncbi:MAG: DNA polymerase III [Candidatus Accumulibacter phosphatis]|uniref:Type-4 uracil-DNA glycosylase n=1 Tax=Candidatus Accumulibacter phosphatis TaxID=327160 RepID=A0A6A7RQ99_9PROT|nr:DNA polymerase III [Candidatus Accumulibacter phosphatis]